MMKRYILLVGANYYPRGWDDYRGSFDDLEAAKTEGNRLVTEASYLTLTPEENDPSRWWTGVDQDDRFFEVVDQETESIAARDNQIEEVA